MEKILFIINPIAGGSRAKNLMPLIEETMKRENIEYEIIQTTKPKEATRIAENSNCHRVVAVGGDGTVNEVAKGLIRRKFGILGIIPSGTGNDMSRSLNLPEDPKKALDIIIGNDKIEVDTALAKGNEFLNIASIGFDAQVVDYANRIKKKVKIKGKFAYVLGILWTLFSYKKKQAIIDIDGKMYNRNIILLAIGNGKYYGGGMMVMPNASLNDGNLHICIVKDMSNFKILFLFPTIFKGNHLKFTKYVETFKGKKVNVKLEKDSPLNLDGDIFKGNRDIQIDISDYKLQILK